MKRYALLLLAALAACASPAAVPDEPAFTDLLGSVRTDEVPQDSSSARGGNMMGGGRISSTSDNRGGNLMGSGH